MKNIPNGYHKFRFWCQKVLPLVYDDSLSYYEVLCKLRDFVNELAERIADVFSDLGALVKENVDNWLDEHPEATTTVQDGSLTIEKFSTALKKRMVICVTDYGVDNTGTNDNAVLLNELFAENGNATYFFPKGTYVVNDTLTIDDSCEIIFDSDAEIVVNSFVETLFRLSTTQESYNSVFEYDRYLIKGGTINCNNNVNTVFLIGVTYKSHMVDVKMKNFNEYGIHILGGGHFLVDNCLIWGKAGNATYGYYNAGYDGNLIDTVVVNCNTAYSSAVDWYTNCTGWLDERGTYANSICFENRSKCFYTQCACDTYQIGWKGKFNSTSEITNGHVMNNAGVATPTANTYVFYGEQQAKFYYNNLFVALTPAYTFVNSGITISGSNLTDAESAGTNLPSYKTFNDFVLKTDEVRTNFTASNLGTYVDNASLNGYFASGAINFLSGWGNLEVKKTDSTIVQIAHISGCPSYTRSSPDNGTTWTSWTQYHGAVDRSHVNITTTIVNSLTTNGELFGWFESSVVGTQGWGYIRTIVSDTFVFQMAIVAGSGAKTRLSNNGGSSWGAWS